jgi:hypothetical protein
MHLDGYRAYTTGGNIVSDKNRFRAFQNDLDEAVKRITLTKSYPTDNNFPVIINEVEFLKKYYLKKLAAIDPNRSEKIEVSLKFFHDTYFASFQRKDLLLKFLFEKSRNLEYFRKLAQLNHTHGIIQNNITGDSEVMNESKMYMNLLLFLDYFEIFPKYLRPILMRIWKMELKHEWIEPTSTREFYYLIYWIMNAKLFRMKELKHYLNIRNSVAHSSSIISDETLIFPPRWFNSGKKPIKYKLKEIEQEITLFMYLPIIFSTDLDLRIFSLFNCGNKKLFPYWIEYLQYYNGEIQRM